MVTILRSIVSTWSIHGKTKNSPGPLAFLDVIRPSLKMTARWYSFTICAQQEDRRQSAGKQLRQWLPPRQVKRPRCTYLNCEAQREGEEEDDKENGEGSADHPARAQ